MKSIKRVVLKDSEVLDDQQMKRIFGGSGNLGGCINLGCHSTAYLSATLKEKACCDKALNASCSWKELGITYSGVCKCQINHWFSSSVMHCSDLNL
jgi:natural product precursor